jgi:hypothetical protein
MLYVMNKQCSIMHISKYLNTHKVILWYSHDSAIWLWQEWEWAIWVTSSSKVWWSIIFERRCMRWSSDHSNKPTHKDKSTDKNTLSIPQRNFNIIGTSFQVQLTIWWLPLSKFEFSNSASNKSVFQIMKFHVRIFGQHRYHEMLK